MSVAVIPMIQHSYMEPYIKNTLRCNSDSDSASDAGYGTPAESLFVTEQEQTRMVLTEKLSNSGGDEIVTDSNLQEKVMKQVEWYFSDENLLKDSFLMKHINRNKQGYVSLKLVASLRKVKALSKDWKVVLESLKHSNLLALNEEETKIRRKSPAPQVDFRHIAKTLLITGYPDQDPNLANLEQHFGRYSEVAQVRLIHPGRAIPLDVKPCKAQHPSLGKDLCILVEFGSEELAKLAYRRIREQQSWRDEMKVQLLGEKNAQESKDFEDRPSRSSSDTKKKSIGRDSKTSETQSQAKQKGGLHHSRENWLRDSPSPKSSREGAVTRQLFQRKVSPPSSSSLDTQRRWKSQGVKCSPEFSRKHLRPDAWKDYSSDSGMSCGSRSSSESPKFTPEPARKFFSNSSSNTELSWRLTDRHSHANSSVIRQPLGPDGTRGFSKPRITQSC